MSGRAQISDPAQGLEGDGVKLCIDGVKLCISEDGQRELCPSAAKGRPSCGELWALIVVSERY